jgi:hypothetical protein
MHDDPASLGLALHLQQIEEMRRTDEELELDLARELELDPFESAYLDVEDASEVIDGAIVGSWDAHAP